MVDDVRAEPSFIHDRRICAAHGGRPYVRVGRFLCQACMPTCEPGVQGSILAKLRPERTVRSLGGIPPQGADRVGKVGVGLGHRPQEDVAQLGIALMRFHDTQLGPEAGVIGVLETLGEPVDGALGLLDGLVWAIVEERQQRLGQTREVPLADPGLVAVGVAPMAVDRAVDPARVKGIHEGTGAVVDGLARN